MKVVLDYQVSIPSMASSWEWVVQKQTGLDKTPRVCGGNDWKRSLLGRSGMSPWDFLRHQVSLDHR